MTGPAKRRTATKTTIQGDWSTQSHHKAWKSSTIGKPDDSLPSALAHLMIPTCRLSSRPGQVYSRKVRDPIALMVWLGLFISIAPQGHTGQPDHSSATKTSSTQQPCRIVVIDDQNRWPVPMVELRTNHHVRLVTDNAGVIAFDLPELMGKETWFSIIGHGYNVAADGFGFRGVRLIPMPGETLTVEVTRQLPAKRLGRLTGGGLFAESQKFGEHRSWDEQGILGCDSVQTAAHRGRMHWLWGDTILPRYPLGRFHMIGATTTATPLESFVPPLSLRYDYITDPSGTPRDVGEMAGTGPTWISGFISLPDASGTPRLVGTYMKIKPPLTAYEIGQCVWNESLRRFEPHQVLWTRSDQSPEPPVVSDGHPVLWKDDQQRQWLLFGDPFPRLRMPATFEAWADRSTWQIIEPQAAVPQATVPQVAVPAAEGNREIRPHRGSIAWNAYRNRWVTVFTEMLGQPTPLGELWYAEAPEPTGPWGDAVKVVTHDHYTFYNPRLHPEFTQGDSPILLFEATYTKEFSGNPEPTPRYDYNQILYRLDLDEFP